MKQPIVEEVYFTQQVPSGILCAILLGEQSCEAVEGAQLDDWSINIDGNVPPVEEKVMPEV